MKEIHSKALSEKKENGDDQDAGNEGSSLVKETSRMPFLMLGLDLPPPPLFKDVMEKNIIPQVGLLYCWCLQRSRKCSYDQNLPF